MVERLSLIHKSAAQPPWSAGTCSRFPKADLSALRGRAERGGAEQAAAEVPAQGRAPPATSRRTQKLQQVGAVQGGCAPHGRGTADFRIRLRVERSDTTGIRASHPFPIPEGWQRTGNGCHASGMGVSFGGFSGGIAALNHRLMAGMPPAFERLRLSAIRPGKLSGGAANTAGLEPRSGSP